jgi:hypothetical protein
MALRVPLRPADGLRAGAARLAAMPRPHKAALAVTALWAVLVVAYAAGFIAAPGAARLSFLDGAFLLVAFTLPLVMVWMVAGLSAELARQRALVEELADAAGPLADALGETRQVLEREGPVSEDDIHAAVARAMLSAPRADPGGAALAEIRAAHAQLEATLSGSLATLAARVAELDRPAATPAPAPQPDPEPVRRAAPPAAEAGGGRQADLPLVAADPDADAPLDWQDLVRALDFPRDAEDRGGFQALRRALRHHRLAQMLQAAEDVLTLLSQEGIYMDDLAHERGDPADWRRFMAGQRGAAVAGVGGIRDPHALEVTKALMRSDQIFRDTALFFQRRFDVILSEFGAQAGDADLAAIADTRSGRAFQLLARLSGSFE